MIHDKLVTEQSSRLTGDVAAVELGQRAKRRVADMEASSFTARGIPRSLAPFFQEYDLDDLDPDRAAATIIERTLRYGNRAELRWLFARYQKAIITDWVRRWGRFGLPAPHLAFWRLLLGLGEGE